VSAARRWLPTLLFAVAFAAALARVSGFFTDDSYIHLVFARNLVHGQPFCFNSGQPTYGFTSPLWMLLLAAGRFLTPDWLVLARLLGLLFTLLAVAATHRLARAAGGSPGASDAAAVSLAFHAWFLRWSLSGMETSLAAFLVAAGLAGVLGGGRRATAGMVGLALAALVRPEALILFVAAGAWAARRRSAVGPNGETAPAARAPVVLGLALGVVVLAAWELAVHAGTGAWIPNAYTVKRFHEAVTLGGVAVDTARFAGIVGITDLVLVLVAVTSAVTLRRAREPVGPLGLLLLWPALLAAFYLGARVQMISRYWVPAAPALCAAAWVGVERAVRATDAKLRFAPALLSLYLAQQLAVFVILIAPQIDAFTRGLNRGPVAIGRWLQANAVPSAVVATPDIGAIGFYGERPVLDLGGLITPAMAPILAHHDIHQVMEGALYEAVAHPDYLVDRAERPGALLVSAPPATGRRLELVLAYRMENLGISRPGPVYYSLYRVLPAGSP
jgi:hypothetical protein